MAPNSLKYFKYLTLAIGIFSLYFPLAHFYNLGLSYDEAIFINGATLKDDYTFAFKKIFGIPTMSFTYIGALKSWIYYPIFKIFGLNIYSIRLPMLVLMGINLVLIYKILIKYLDATLVLCLIIILSTDLTFSFLHIIDNGPSALETFLKLLSIYLIAKKPSLFRCLGICLVLLLGIFNKVNFIWFVNAYFGMVIILELVNIYRSGDSFFNINSFKKSRIPLFTALYIGLASFFIFIIKLNKIETKLFDGELSIVTIISNQFSNLIRTLVNNKIYDNLAWSIPYQNWAYYLVVGLLLFFCINFIYLIKNKKIKQFEIGLFTLSFLLFLQYLITKEAVNIWHPFFLYPFLHLLVLKTVESLSFLTFKKAALVYIFTFLVFSFNLFSNFNFLQQTKANCNLGLYQPEIQQLSKYISSRTEAKVISLGWGIHSQLLTFDNKGKIFIEMYLAKGFKGFFYVPADLLTDISDKIVVEHLSYEFNEKGENLKAFQKKLHEGNCQLLKIATIKNKCSQPLYSIYKIEKITSNIPAPSQHTLGLK